MALNDYYDQRSQKAADLVFPFGPADSQSVDYAAAIELALENTKTYVTIGQLTGDVDLTYLLANDFRVGSELEVTATSDASPRNVNLGAGFQWSETDYAGGVVPVAATKTVKLFFDYDGTAFVLKSVIGID